MLRMNALIVSTVIFLSTAAFSQGAGSLNFINNLGDKKTTTWSDAVTFYVMILGRGSGGFRADVAALKRLGYIKKEDYKPGKVLRKGMLARIIARHLKLRDSLFYNIFRMTKRYSYRACVADGIMDVDGSEWDKLSGEELIEIMSIISERME